MRLRLHTQLMSLLTACLTMSVPAQAQPAVQATINQVPEVVYSYDRDRCEWNTIPDSPARALRRDDGSIVLIAAHFRNRFFEGKDFSHLRLNCAAVSQAAESSNPADFNDRVWIQALIPLPGGRVLGLASNEFWGRRHPGACQLGPKEPLCWYMAVTALVADQKNMEFQLLPRDRRVVIAAGEPYRSTMEGIGFPTTSNVIFANDAGHYDTDGKWAYAMVWSQGFVEGASSGSCLIRAPRQDIASGIWEQLTSDGWRRTQDPYLAGKAETSRRCQQIGKGSLRSKIRSLVWLKREKVWIATFMTRGLQTAANVPDSGVFYATSPDLLTWSKPNLLANFEPFWAEANCKEGFEYPSLIDHEAPDPTFQTTDGRLYLYLTRFDAASCRRKMDRDLVRYPVTIQAR